MTSRNGDGFELVNGAYQNRDKWKRSKYRWENKEFMLFVTLTLKCLQDSQVELCSEKCADMDVRGISRRAVIKHMVMSQLSMSES